MPEIRIAAENRTEFGKGAARRTRRASRVPAVLYGHGEAPRHLSLPNHELMRALRAPNVLLSLQLDNGKVQLALPRDIQRDPVRGTLEHVDLVAVATGEAVTVDVVIEPTGDVAAGGLLVVDAQTVSVSAEATHLPTSILVDVSTLEVGGQVHASDLVLPQGVALLAAADTLILSVATPTLSVEAEDAAAAEEAADSESADADSTDSAGTGDGSAADDGSAAS